MEPPQRRNTPEHTFPLIYRHFANIQQVTIRQKIMATPSTEVNLPSQVPRVAGNLNEGQDYERKLLLFIAASLSQNKEVKDFAIVSNPKGIEKIDDVVVRISFEDSGKDIALFVQLKHTTANKLLWLKLNDEGKRPAQKCYEIKLEDYQKAFSDVIKMLNSNIPESEELLELLKGVDVKNYYVCIFTNMEKVDPELECKQFDEDHPMYFFDTRNRGQYQQFDYEKDAEFNTNFYKQLYVFLGQTNCKDMDNLIAQVLGEDAKKIPYLDKVIKDFMQRDLFCAVLTKKEFEMKLCEASVNNWMVVDKKVKVIIEKYMELWNKIFSREEIINLCDDKIAALLAYHYQCIIRNEVDEYFDWQEGVTKLTQTTKDCIQQKYSKNVTDLNDLLLLLWRENKIPLAIKSECTPNILNFLTKFKTLKRRFVIFYGENSPELKDFQLKKSVIAYVREITDHETLEKISDLEVSLEGRLAVSLSEISGVSIDIAVNEIYKDLAISQLLTWTQERENSQHIIGPQLRAPDDKYITRNFKDQGEKELTEEAVLELVRPGLHIITGEPGMGKSTVLEALAHSYKPQDFVIYIKLRDCLADMDNNPATLKRFESDPINYFFNKMTNNAQEKIMKSVMESHRTSKRLCLFLDAFDEILPLHGRRISSLMDKILDNTDIPIFCTTRSHAKNKITRRGGTITYKLLPLDYEQIEGYFTKRNINKNILWRFDYTFTSNPLHLRMTSQIYVDYEDTIKLTRGEMYKLFIELKHKTYNDKMNLTQNVAYLSIVKSMKQHRELAMLEIFGEDRVTSKGLIPEILKDICDQNMGIVDVRNSNKSFQFVHRTFAEYFVADLLMNTLKSVSNTKYFDHFYKLVWDESTYWVIKEMIKELACNFDLWIEARKHFCGGFFGWLKCRIYRLNGNRSTMVDSINMDYPTHAQLTEGDGDTCANLLTAIHVQNEEGVESHLSRSLLETGAGIVAFNLAITTGNESIVQLLLDLRPTLVDEQDAKGNTGLHISCAFGYSSIAGFLFEQRANFSIRNDKGKTPLGMATENEQWGIWKIKHIDEIRKRSGEDGHASSTKHFSTDLSEALFIASTQQKWGLVKQLLQYGVDPSTSYNNGWTLMHFAARDEQNDIIEMLLKMGFNINEKTKDGKTPLSISRDCHRWGSIQLLLDNGADPTIPNDSGLTLMHYCACILGDFDTLKSIKMLSQRGFNVNEKANDGLTPLAIACLWPNWYMAKWLVENGADLTLSNKIGWTCMHAAAGGGQLEICKILLERCLTVNEKTITGDTPLTIASRCQKWSIAKWLLECGADPTLSDENGWTSMHFAARDGELEIIEMLWNGRLNVNEKTNDGKTPLAISCGNGKWHIVKWLLDHDADPILSDEDGWTLMHFAARGRQLEIAKILLERGFSVNEKTNDGETPLSIVYSRGWTEMIELLLEHDSDRS